MTSPPRRGLLLRVAGPKRPTEHILVEAGRTRPFAIGRTHLPTNELVISDAIVARRHCQIRELPDGWVLEDQQSSGGTFIAGRRITEPHRLAVGTVIPLGNVRCEVLDLDVTAGPDEYPAAPKDHVVVTCRGVTCELQFWRWPIASLGAAFAEVVAPLRAPFVDPCELMLAVRAATAQLARAPAIAISPVTFTLDADALALLREAGEPGRTAWHWLRLYHLAERLEPEAIVVGAIATDRVADLAGPGPALLAAIGRAPPALLVWLRRGEHGRLLAIDDGVRIRVADHAFTIERGGDGWELALGDVAHPLAPGVAIALPSGWIATAVAGVH